jgi:hypothetical protein
MIFFDSSIIVDHLRKNLGADGEVAVMYCDYKNGETQSPENLMASLWRQFVFGHPLSDTVKKLHTKHHEPHTHPSLDEVMEVLLSHIRGYSQSKVFVVVDAVDECTADHNSRQTLLTKLRELQPHIHLMITSRPHITLEYDFPDIIRLEITQEANDDDIQSYVSARISGDRHLAGMGLQNDIKEAVVGSAAGMYVPST